jgi:hypothetical protein
MKLIYTGRYNKVAVTRPDDTREVVVHGGTFTTTDAHAAALLSSTASGSVPPR